MLIQPEIFEACLAGNNAAWQNFFIHCSKPIYRWAVFLGLSATEAEDATQQVLLTSYRRMDNCKNAAILDAWLYQVTRRVVANIRRSVWKRRRSSAEPAFAATIEVEPEIELAIRNCLARLPKKYVEVLTLIEIEGYSRDEAAVMINKSPGTVASRLRLARLAFKREWAKEMGDGEIEHRFKVPANSSPINLSLEPKL